MKFQKYLFCLALLVISIEGTDYTNETELQASLDERVFDIYPWYVDTDITSGDNHQMRFYKSPNTDVHFRLAYWNPLSKLKFSTYK